MVLIEFHPVAMVFDRDWTHARPYFAGGAPRSVEHGVGDDVEMTGAALAPSGYVDSVQGFVNPHPGHEVHRGIGEVATAMLDAGLVVTALREYPSLNAARRFGRMREQPGWRLVLPEDVPPSPAVR